jgi:hypothetical protein
MSTTTSTPLSFIDHMRQDYAERVPSPTGTTDFLIGDYGDGTDGTGDLGELKIVIHDLRDIGGGSRVDLTPQLCVFGDGTGALAELTRLCGGDLSKLLADVRGPAAFARRLLDLGLADQSDKPLED